MAKKYYVVWEGRETGIFTDWAQCKAKIDGFSGARFKSFPTLAEAEFAFNGRVSLKSEKSDLINKVTSPKSKSLTQEQVTDMPFDIKIFTDGACEPNPGEAGTGLAVYQKNTLIELWYGLYQSVGTNNTAELRGLHQALLLAKDKLSIGLSVAIYCDSKYSIDCIARWAVNWEKKGWTKSGGDIKNLDIIKPAYVLYQELFSKVAIYHINGHIGIEGNELADRMSVFAIKSKDNNLSFYREEKDISKILALRTG